jgi:hypothetical protein
VAAPVFSEVVQQTLRMMGVQPDMWILPEGAKVYLTNVRKENFMYHAKGPAGQAMYNSGLNGKQGLQLDKQNDCMIFEAKQFEVPGVQDPVDVLARNQSIGEYVTMINHLTGQDMGKYETRMRDILETTRLQPSLGRLGRPGGRRRCAHAP